MKKPPLSSGIFGSRVDDVSWGVSAIHSSSLWSFEQQEEAARGSQCRETWTGSLPRFTQKVILVEYGNLPKIFSQMGR